MMNAVLKQPVQAPATLRLPANGRAQTLPEAVAQPASAPAIPVAPPSQAPRAPHEQAELQTATSAPEQAAAPAIDPAALRAELDALRDQARREGLAEGHARAEQESRNAMEAQAQRWRSSIEALRAEMARKLQALEPLAVAVGYEALARVLGRAYADGSGIEHTARQLLEEATGALNLRVQVAPAHLQHVQAALAQHAAAGAQAWQFEADPSLGDHECRIVSERGRLETSLALQLDAVRSALLATAEATAEAAAGDATPPHPAHRDEGQA